MHLNPFFKPASLRDASAVTQPWYIATETFSLRDGRCVAQLS